MPVGELTLKQEAFVQAYLETDNATEAYRQAYPNQANGSKPETLYTHACMLLKSEKVMSRVNELQEASKRRNDVTIDNLVSDLEAARVLAHEVGQAGAATQATMAKAKLHGLGSDRLEISSKQALERVKPEDLEAYIQELQEQLPPAIESAPVDETD